VSISNIVATTSHPKSIIKSLITNDGLPFSEVLSSVVIGSSISNISYRKRYEIYPPDVTLWAMLSQALDADQSLDAAVSRVIAFHLSQGRENDISRSTSAYSQARAKLPEEMISNLVRQSAEQMEESLPKNWLWQMIYHLKLVDGSTISMPDTPENQALYPQPDSQKKELDFLLRGLLLLFPA
jgi:hypothetical protein